MKKLFTKLVTRYPIIKQLSFFGLIGFSAGIVQLVIVMLLVELNNIQPLKANIIGFLVAFLVSYFGHRHFTFSGTRANHYLAVLRFFLIAASNFIANEYLFFIFLKVFHLQYLLALFLVLSILPVLTFLISKRWVFNND